MRDILKRFIPEYFSQKAEGIDERQVNELPDDIRNKIVYGTEEQVASAFREIRDKERQMKTELLGTAAIDRLADMRSTVEQSKK